MECSSRTDAPALEIEIPVREEDKKSCWVCFSTEEDDENALWVRPCKCKGSSKWVHQLCLQRWVAVKLKGNPVEKVSCPQCNTEYIIVYPKMGSLIVILDSINTVIINLCPFVAAGVVVASIYWVAVSYGAITVMQIMGHDEALEMMESTDSVALFVGLPMIPVALILSRIFNWEDTALTFLRRHARKVPVLKYILPSFMWYSLDNRQNPESVPPINDSSPTTRVLCSALLLPTVASLTGDLLFRSVQSKVQRTFLGGIAFLTIKGIIKIYYKQQDYIRQCQRKILDYPNGSPTSSPNTARQDAAVETETSE